MLRLLIAAAAVALAPGLAAAGCSHDRQANITCAPGSTYDEAAGTCVPDATG
ncbi:hypothetical protein [Jannaschia sp. W003]|uniref:hypothetical protein n=1 Tax=Jannaschia sp. W003 TaxID=2867012 RepID=UPI0021A72831|nr:hypothetical protein [Jannaschia sp. W003]UWQ20185.1 hypothetical protein K3554_09220 [Jannaschia sp. W003]